MAQYGVPNIAVPLQMYQQARTYRSQQKLADLTLSTAEKKAKDEETYNEIMQSSLSPSGQIDSKRAYQSLNQAGLFKKAEQVKVNFFQNKKAIETRRAEQRKFIKDRETEMGITSDAILSSKNPVESFLLARDDAYKKGNKWSDNLSNYMADDFSIKNGKLPIGITKELQWNVDKNMTTEQRIARAKLDNSDDVLNEKFRTEFLPSIDVELLTKEKNARNKMVKRILSSPYGQTSLAKETIKNLKGNPSNLADQIAAALSKNTIKGQNRPVPASQAVEIGGTADAIGSLDKVMRVIPAVGGTGVWTPITDPLNSLNPWNTRVQAKKQYIATIKQVIGKGLEGGVLRAEDERKYEKIIPKMGDTEEAFLMKGKQLKEAIRNKRKYMLQGLRSAGFNVSGFADLSKEEPKRIGKWRKLPD